MDLTLAGEAVLQSGKVSARALFSALRKLSSRGSTSGAELLDTLVEDGALSADDAALLRGSGAPNAAGPGRPASVRQLATQLNIQSFATLVREPESKTQKPVDMSSVPTLVERPTNRAQRILLETRVAVSAKSSKGSGTGDDQTRILVGATRPPLPNVPTPVTLRAPDAQPEQSDAERTVDGKYWIGERIGRGGMGDVFLARDLDLGRDVALKTLTEESRGDDTLIRALIHEARLTGQLQHPNIIPVYELGLLSSGRVYYTMKLLSELSLHQVFHQLRAGDENARKEYTLLRLLNVFQRVCMALNYAHSRGVLHRDIKPDNILLGQFGEVQLTDWGIATLVGRPDVSAFAERGTVAGTPPYMSPEQASGDLVALDQRSDIYSLGVILYEILTLELPHRLAPEVTEPLAILSVKRQPITPPHLRAPARRIPEALSYICLRALSFDPVHRHPDARALWREIEEFLEGTKEQERLRERARRDVQRGLQKMEQFRGYLAELAALKSRLDELERQASPWDPESERRALWDAKNRRRALDIVISQMFSDAVNTLERALVHDSANEEARRALESLYAVRIRVAEEEADIDALVYFEERRRELAAEAGQEPGQLTVRSSPEGVEVFAFRADELGASLPFDGDHRLGTAPIHRAELAPGSYMLVGRLAGFRDTLQVVTVRPGEHNFTMLLLSDWSEEVPLVGRVDELERLRFQHLQLVETQRLRAVLISGAPGSGKGRLLNAFSSYIADRPEPYLYLSAHARAESRWVAFSTVAGMLRHRLGVRPGDEPSKIMARLLDFVAYALFGVESVRECSQDHAAEVRRLAGIIGRMPGLGALPGATRTVGQTGLRASLFDALSEVLSRLTQQMPLVVVLRAVHHADATSRAFYEEVLQKLAGCPVMIVCTTTPEDASAGVLDRLPFHDQLSLGPLRPEAVAQLLRDLLHGAPSDALVAAIHHHSGGHAHAVEDVVRTLVQKRAVEQRSGFYSLKPAFSAILEGGYDLRAHIEDRLMALGRPVQEALEAAAVVGSTFTTDVLAAMGIDDPEWCVSALVDAELVVRQPRSDRPDGVEYRFRHADIRLALLELIDPERRALLHYAAASWIASEGELSPLRKARLAIHLRAVGALQRAALLHEELATLAAAVGGFEDAARNLREAAALAEEGNTAARVALLRVEVLSKLSRHPELQAAVEDLVEFQKWLTARERVRAKDALARLELPAALAALAEP
jgi:serine/threonine protein kinase